MGSFELVKEVLNAMIADTDHTYDDDDIRLLWDYKPDGEAPAVSPRTIEFEPLKVALNNLVSQPGFCYR
jgi:hypothetical protein